MRIWQRRTHYETPVQCFLTILPWRNPQNNFTFSDDSQPVRTSTGQKIKEAVGITQRLLQYCQWPDKKFLLYFEGDLEFFAVFVNVYIFQDFSRNPLQETFL
jgi:hypothetical protein